MDGSFPGINVPEILGEGKKGWGREGHFSGCKKLPRTPCSAKLTQSASSVVLYLGGERGEMHQQVDSGQRG